MLKALDLLFKVFSYALIGYAFLLFVALALTVVLK